MFQQSYSYVKLVVVLGQWFLNSFNNEIFFKKILYRKEPEQL